MSNKKKNSKKRIPLIGLGFNVSDKNLIEISYINIEDNKLILKDKNNDIIKPNFITIAETYERKKGHKIINQATDYSKENNLNINKILKSYTSILVVDTNYKTYGSKYLCVSSSSIATWADNRHLSVFPQSNLAFLLTNKEINPELYGWIDIIERFKLSSLYNIDDKFALVVDSELGDLLDYSKGKKAILNNYYIPNNFDLVYASSDVGKSAINKIMSNCDKSSKKILSQLENLVDVQMYNKNIPYHKINYFI
jgi:hypothetical protein